MVILRRVLNNRYYDITKQVLKELTSVRESDLVAITEDDLVSICRNSMVLECPDTIDPERMPISLEGALYHVRQGRKNMLLKQNYNEPPEE